MGEGGRIAKHTRERIALVVFAALVILAVAALSSYFLTGRSWNVAASFVDDTVGQMKGYTALVYAGTGTSARNAARLEAETATISQGVSLSQEAATEGADASEPDVADSVGLGLLALLPAFPNEYKGVYVSDVRDIYEQKEANVLSLNVASSVRYAVPTVLNAGDVRIGVFSVRSYTTKARLNQYREFFEKAEVDTVVCITERLALLADLSALDVVIATDDPDETTLRGRFVGDTLVVSAAPVDAVGVILFSPTFVPSAKVVDAL